MFKRTRHRDAGEGDFEEFGGDFGVVTSTMWPMHTLESLVEPDRPITYGVVKPGDHDPNGVYLIRGGDIFNGRILVDQLRTISAELSNQYKRTFLRGGELVVSLVGNPGHVAVVPDHLAGANLARQAGLVALRHSEVSAVFLKYYLMSPQGRAGLLSQSTGSAQIVINLADLRRLRVPVAPLDVQHRIAGILTAYDDLIENCERRIRALDAMVRALYREWFVFFRYPGHETIMLVDSSLGRIPKGWGPATIGAITEFLNRGISPKYDDDGPSTVINQKCIRDFRLSLLEARRQNKPFPDERRVRVGDVLINSTGVGTLGRVAQVLEDLGNCTVDTHVTIARPAAKIDSTFLGMTLFELQGVFESKGVGATGQTELSRTAIGEITIAVPPRERQEQFAERVRPMREETLNLQKRAQNLRKTRDLLLPRLFSGQLKTPAVISTPLRA